MRIIRGPLALWLGGALLWIGAARAQLRGGVDWVTAGADAQRSFWVRTDAKISAGRVRTPGFQLVWKMKLKDEPSPAATMSRYIGYRGFRSLVFLGGASGEVTTIDTDLERIEWRKKLAAEAVPGSGSAGCPGGMTAELTRPTTVGFPGAPAGRGGAIPGRSGPAKSGVGQPDEGAVTVAEMAARAAMAPPGGRGPGAPPLGPMPSLILALSTDGLLHSMYVSNGEESAPPVPFLPPNSNAHGLAVVNNVAYAATSRGCGGAPSAVWALDLISRQAIHWTADGDVAGEPGFAFGPDGTIYAATASGELAALDPKALEKKGAYHPGTQAFTTSPVVFEYNTRATIAAATNDGRLHLVDAASLTGTAYSATVSGALASWQDPAGTRWIAAPSKDTIAAWKVTDQGGTPALQTGWTSREMASPLAPIVINGVLFAVSNSSAPVLYALDGQTGKELWNSGKTMAAPVRRGGLSGSDSHVYLGTSDGIIYAFGFPVER